MPPVVINMLLTSNVVDTSKGVSSKGVSSKGMSRSSSSSSSFLKGSMIANANAGRSGCSACGNH